MTLIIAHRGNLLGPNKNWENHPVMIKACLDFGYNVEIDVQNVDPKSGVFEIGHDPDGQIYSFFPYEKGYDYSRIWFHCKNLTSFTILNNMNLMGGDNHRMKFFYHDDDQVTFINDGTVWFYPNKSVPKCPNGIWVLPELHHMKNNDGIFETLDCDPDGYLGFCTDYPILLEKHIHILRTIKNSSKEVGEEKEESTVSIPMSADYNEPVSGPSYTAEPIINKPYESTGLDKPCDT